MRPKCTMKESADECARRDGIGKGNPSLYRKEGMFYLGPNASSSYKGEINFLIAEEAKISPQTLESAWGHTPLVAYDTRAVCTA